MGRREAHLSQIINWLFQGARVHNQDDGVWDQCEFLWIDGSLFYRAFNWAKTGTTWRDYAATVCAALRDALVRCPRLRVVVYSIDKYGHSTRPALPKEPTQAHRYEGCQPVPCPVRVYQLDESCVGISSTDTFGDMRARMAFNAMISAEIQATLRAVLDSPDNAVELAILDGAVSVCTVPAMQPEDYEAHESDPPRGTSATPGASEFRVYRPGVVVMGTSELMPPRDEWWCCHSEGDIGLSHWLPKFVHLNSVVHSCDVDLQQVTLQVVRRLCDAGLRPEQLPRMHLFKKVAGLEHTFDMKRYYQLVCSIVQPLLADDDPSHPLDVWAALTAVSGNDFCAPWLCSEKCRLGEKDNDGVRLESVWATFVAHAKKLSPLFMPVTEANRVAPLGAKCCTRKWSSLQLPAFVYPMEMRVEAWRALMEEACSVQLARTDLKVGSNSLLIGNKQYVAAQVRRISWALSYYANAALLGDQMPRGTETDERGRSVHGWLVTAAGATEMTSRVRVDTETVCGAPAAHATTAPPSPADAQLDPVGEFERLCANMDE